MTGADRGSCTVDAELNVGQLVGSYRVLRPLGSGGMGRVYEVEHVHLGVHYALKALSVEGPEGVSLRHRFVSEGRMLARLTHPNLVRVIDLDVEPTSGLPYFVMDLVLGDDGESHTLADVGREGCGEEKLSLWFDELCSALDYIHAQGVVHRDVKLENVLVSRDGHVLLSDFGISRIVGDRLRREIDVTRTILTGVAGNKGFVMGTQGYLAPEVRLGEAATPAADVYSLAVAFFRLLTNVWYDPALGADDAFAEPGSMNVVEMLRFFEYNWQEVLPKMLSTQPEHRPGNLRELAGTLRRPQPGTGSLRRRAAAVAAFAAAAVLGAIALWVWRSRSPADAPESASRMAEFDDAFGYSTVQEVR